MPRRLPLLLTAALISLARLPAADSPTLFLIGDSTVTNQPVIPAQPGRGWGQVLPLYLKPGIHVENFASSGQSSRSFILTGIWKKVHDRLKAGDFLIIQFGHNDGKPEEKRHTEAFAEYTDNLTRYVHEARELGATPILATPPCRAVFNRTDGQLMDTHHDYPIAMRQLAEKEHVPLLDLEAKTAELLRRLGPDRAKSLFANAEPGDYAAFPQGRADGTHFNAYGASIICDFVAADIAKNAPHLAKWLLEGKTQVLEPDGNAK
jgi:lysophospholipase L1-like esterase